MDNAHTGLVGTSLMQAGEYDNEMTNLVWLTACPDAACVLAPSDDQAQSLYGGASRQRAESQHGILVPTYTPITTTTMRHDDGTGQNH
jgi:hypothetical protein